MSEDLFEADRPWLRDQPGMQPWTAGCAALNERLAAHVRETTANLTLPAETDMPLLRDRLWHCWRHHWRGFLRQSGSAGVSGNDVWDNVRNCQGAKGHLGSDPFFDLVLTHFALRDDNDPATVRDRFRITYRDVIRASHSTFATDEHAVNDLLSHVLGTPEEHGRVTQFCGEAGLVPWLRITSRRWALDQHRGVKRRTERETLASEQTPHSAPAAAALVAEGECRRTLVDILTAALNTLDDRSRLAFVEHDREGRTLEEIGAVLKRNKGSVSRLLKKTRQQLRAYFADELSERPGLEDCMRELGLSLDALVPGEPS